GTLNHTSGTLTLLGDLLINDNFYPSPGTILSISAAGDQELDFGCQDVETVHFTGSGVKNMTGSGFDVQEMLHIDGVELRANSIRIALEDDADWLEENGGFFNPVYSSHN